MSEDKLHISPEQAATWFDFSTPSARYATVNDLVVLKALLPDMNQGSVGWGLKEFGYLLCLQGCQSTGAQRFLDVGVGCGHVFDSWLPPSVDSWAIDEPGFYPTDAFEAGLKRRARTTFRSGLLGQPDHGLPEGAFSAIGSVSVLEHAFDDLGPDASMADRTARAIGICRDMLRLLEPDGVAIHTIDIATTTPWIGEVWAEALATTGLIPESAIDLHPNDLNLYEPISIQHTYYYGPAAKSLEFPVRRTFSRTRSLIVIAKPL